jgi:CBS domain-containing protein
MREKGVGGLPVMDTNGAKAIGNISIRDVQYLLTAPKIYKEHRFVILMHLVDENPYVW